METPQTEIFESALEIWEGGSYLEGTYINGRKANLYLFNNDYYLIWFNNSNLHSIEKINREFAARFFPTIVSNLKVVV